MKRYIAIAIATTAAGFAADDKQTFTGVMNDARRSEGSAQPDRQRQRKHNAAEHDAEGQVEYPATYAEVIERHRSRERFVVPDATLQPITTFSGAGSQTQCVLA